MNKTYMVLGAGVSGQGACRLLCEQDRTATVFLVDKKEQNLPSSLDKKYGANIHMLTEDAALANCDLHSKLQALILSSGIAESHPLVQKIAALNIEIVSEADLAFRYFQGCAIGITGTNGKSTVTKLIAHLLTKAGYPCLPCGNYGDPLGEAVLRNEGFSYLAVELSSYQLASSKNLHLNAGVFVNFAPDHEAWHGNSKNYFLAKWRLINNLKVPTSYLVTSPSLLQTARSFRVEIPADLNLLLACKENESLDETSLPRAGKHEVFYWNDQGLKDAAGRTQVHWQDLTMEGAHNYYNAALAALAVSTLPGMSLDDLDFSGFEPLPYRYQRVRTHSGFTAINDSKATNVDAVLAALSSTVSPVVLMLGGISKDESFVPLGACADKIQKLICFGASGASIAQQISDKMKDVQVFPTLREAMDAAMTFIPLDDAVLLFSPGCASFDEFKNYNERGAYFSQRALEL